VEAERRRRSPSSVASGERAAPHPAGRRAGGGSMAWTTSPASAGSWRNRPPTGALDCHRWWRFETEIRSGGPAIDRTEDKHFSAGRTATFL